MIKRILTAALLLAGIAAFAQEDAASFRSKYERQVRMVGYAGVGVETILDRWEAAFPEDPYMLEGRFRHCFAKSRSSHIEAKYQPKFLGSEPVFSLKDSTGRDIYYYEEDFFVDSLFARSQKAIDKAIALQPAELAWRIDKAGALLIYEKESPDLTCAEVLKMIDYQASARPQWTHYGEEMPEGTLAEAVLEYCFTFFRYGSPGGYEAFRKISERMLKLYPGNAEYMNNLGSYYLVCQSSPKKALKWYGKALKADPLNYTAAHNCVLIARRNKDVKLEKKYLPTLIQATQDEIERKGYEARLEALGKK